MRRFVRHLAAITVLLIKCAAIVVTLAAWFGAILALAFWLVLSVSVAGGIAWGIGTFLLTTAAIVTIHENAESEQPVWDWLKGRTTTES